MFAPCPVLSKAGTLDGARHSVGLIVGRDTDRLSEPEIVRATVETIAEERIGRHHCTCLLSSRGAALGLSLQSRLNLDSMIGHQDTAYGILDGPPPSSMMSSIGSLRGLLAG